MERNKIRTSSEIASASAKILAIDDLRQALTEVINMIAEEKEIQRKQQEEEFIKQILRSLAGSTLSNRRA